MNDGQQSMKTALQPPLYLLLASMSRYRAACLAKLGVQFDQWAPCIDETPKPNEHPRTMVIRLAEKKAQAALTAHQDGPSSVNPYTHIIASDQTMTLQGQSLGKPHTRAKAQEQLKNMSGNTVTFFTSLTVLCMHTHEFKTAVETTTVRFRQFSHEQIEQYLNIDEPYDCAGSFKSESAGIALCHSIEGKDPNALIGLPLITLTDLLLSFGYEILSGGPSNRTSKPPLRPQKGC